MSAAASQILEQFNVAFVKFLDPNTPQEERSAIDRAFVDFEKQPDSWRVCLEMMTLTTNPNIHLIIQDTFIYVLKHRWLTLNTGEKNTIRESEIAFYVNGFRSYRLNIMQLTAKTIAWISIMESDQCLQQLLDFISGGLQNPAECDPQLLLLLVLLEEVYETGNSIPLLTEKRDTIQKVISDGVCGIVQSVNAILQHAAELSEDTIRESLNILLILIPHNDLSRVLDVSVVECLFRFISDFNNPLSLDAMKCVNELLLKHLIPYSFRSVYCRIINTITSLMLAVAQDVDAISPEYTKQLILLVYELTVNYITPMLAQPDFDLVQYLAALLHS
ncbi:hypothetical protein WA577_001221, partial [Blastocystis sp. JDR]